VRFFNERNPGRSRKSTAGIVSSCPANFCVTRLCHLPMQRRDSWGYIESAIFFASGSTSSVVHGHIMYMIFTSLFPFLTIRITPPV
jgi:hypothetical protein